MMAIILSYGAVAGVLKFPHGIALHAIQFLPLCALAIGAVAHTAAVSIDKRPGRRSVLARAIRDLADMARPRAIRHRIRWSWFALCAVAWLAHQLSSALAARPGKHIASLEETDYLGLNISRDQKGGVISDVLCIAKSVSQGLGV